MNKIEAEAVRTLTKERDELAAYCERQHHALSQCNLIMDCPAHSVDEAT